MTNVHSANFQKDALAYVEQAIRSNPVNVITELGEAVIISMDQLRGIRETAYLESIPGMKEYLIESRNAPKSEFVKMGNRTLEEMFDDIDDDEI